MVEQRLKAGSLATIDDVLRLHSEGEDYELSDGRLVELVPPGFEHNLIMGLTSRLLGAHADADNLGAVVPGDTVFRLDPGARYGRGPDVAFVRRERIPPGRIPGAFPGPPDLAIEIPSPRDKPAELERKIAEYLRFGSSAVVVLYPDTRTASLRRPGGRLDLSPDDELDLDFVLPGFRARVSQFFPPL